MTTLATENTVPVVRELRLRRRRSNVPWIYLLYHVDPKPRTTRPVRAPGAADRAGRKVGGGWKPFRLRRSAMTLEKEIEQALWP
jgi:hypothetical protein